MELGRPNWTDASKNDLNDGKRSGLVWSQSPSGLPNPWLPILTSNTSGQKNATKQAFKSATGTNKIFVAENSAFPWNCQFHEMELPVWQPWPPSRLQPVQPSVIERKVEEKGWRRGGKEKSGKSHYALDGISLPLYLFVAFSPSLPPFCFLSAVNQS